MRKSIIALILTLALFGAAQAQTGGQLWVQAFEDRNGNGTQEPNEPLLTKGIGVDLLNADHIVIASALLDGSPNAARGLVGFQQLPAGQYTLAITGAEFKATTPDQFTLTVSATGVPAVVKYGAQRLSLAPTQAAPASGLAGLMAALPQGQGAQLAFSAVGAAIIVFGMIVLGLLIYLVELRGRMAKARAADARTTGTGSMRAVRATSTGQYPRVDK